MQFFLYLMTLFNSHISSNRLFCIFFGTFHFKIASLENKKGFNLTFPIFMLLIYFSCLTSQHQIVLVLAGRFSTILNRSVENRNPSCVLNEGEVFDLSPLSIFALAFFGGALYEIKVIHFCYKFSASFYLIMNGCYILSNAWSLSI